ncbi:glycosyltransferase family 4 protein [Polaribacter vadi]|uniref:glycosyltransferase family 4 protein n=1 Tax=Polaribacter TaxID=52959 RepID=UPI001C0A2234|nr:MULTISPECIES: glycosyltransferase family 4 protein [Polaribacter]MBU3010926.1 glycosyltransferase family 4 protein [Polaribacter vadi]MDO6740738.1 glycosyltransferase family 4 protein [Polaribacter sp. 1_MG-2023]
MKILILNTLYAPYKLGGAEKSVQSLAESFVKNNYEVLVLTLGEENKKVNLNGVIVDKLEIRNIYWPFSNDKKNSIQKLLWHINDAENARYDKKIIELFKDFKPNILFTNNLSGFSVRAWKLAKKFNIKIVHTLRDYYLQCPKSIKYKNDQNCIKQCFDCKILSVKKKRISQNVDAVVGISNFILDNHISNGYFSNATHKVIYNGFSFDKVKQINKRENKLVFGFIGQINKSKGIEFLLKSFREIEEIDDWELLIAGNINNAYLTSLKNINNSKKIAYLGYIDSTLFFKSIDILIVPSLWEEPFGRVVLEGLIHKKVVLGSNIGGIKELLDNNKDFLFNPHNLELNNILEKLLSSDDFIKKFKFNNEYLDQFLIDNVSNKYVRLFKKVLNR